MKKIALIAINARYTHSNPALYYLEKVVACADGYRSVMYEYTINGSIHGIVTELAATGSDYFCFSVYIWNTLYVKKVLDDLKRLVPTAKFVLGGPEVEHNSATWIQDRTSLVLGGEGVFELALLDGFQRASYSGKDPAFDNVAFPYTANQVAQLKGRYLYYESSRGCPFSCTFCLSSAKKGVSFRSLQKVQRELRLFIEKKVSIVKFVDRTFNSDRERARNIWRFLVENRGETLFHFEIEPSRLEDVDFKLFETVPSGLFQFELGVQSCNTDTLVAVNRTMDIEKVLTNIRRLVSVGTVSIHTDLIAGLPYETFELFGRSFDRIYLCGANHFQLGFLKVLPATKMAARQQEYGVVASSTPPYEIYRSNWITVSQFDLLRRVEDLLEMLWNSERFSRYSRFLAIAELSPFSYFVALACFFEQGQVPFGVRAFAKVAELLLAFHAEYSFSVHQAKDLLAYDYLSVGSSLALPVILITSVKTTKELNREFVRKVSAKVSEKRGKELSRALCALQCTSPAVCRFLDVANDEVLLFVSESKSGELPQLPGYRYVWRR